MDNDWMDTFAELGFYAQRPDTNSRPHAERLLEALDANEPGRWNGWRKRNRRIRPDLRGVELSGRFLSCLDLRDARLDDAYLDRTALEMSDLSGASLKGANLIATDLNQSCCRGANFADAKLIDAQLVASDLSGAIIRGAELRSANLLDADLTGTTFVDADLRGAKLDRANLNGTVLRNCDLGYASFVNARLKGARITGCNARYVNAKRIEIESDVVQKDLFLGFIVRSVYGGLYTRRIEANDLRVASFVGELEKPDALTHLINAGTDYIVLVLGSFDKKGRQILSSIEENLWNTGRIPIVFEFEGPNRRALVDAVRFFGVLSEFVIVDMTDPRSVAFELNALVPDLAVPVVPLIREGATPFAMFADLQRKYPWVMRPFAYRTTRQIDQQFPAIVELAQSAREDVGKRYDGTKTRPLPIRWAGRLARELEERRQAEEDAAHKARRRRPRKKKRGKS
jgi:uncharacterized protein YjbI with pentapeptide repeats